MRGRTALATAVGVGSIVLAPGVARAQVVTGFALSRFEPAERGTRSFVTDELVLRGRPRPAIGLTLDLADRPLVARGPSGEERFALVRSQLLAHVGASLVLADRFRAGLDVPLALHQDGEDAVIGGDRHGAANGAALGDTRLAFDARAFGQHDAPITLAVGLRGWLPTGSRAEHTSDGSLRVAPQVMVAGRIGAFVWAARTTLAYRPRDDRYAGAQLGSELGGAVSAGARLWDGRMVIGPEVWAASALPRFLGKQETGANAIVGAHLTFGPMRIGAGFGLGLGEGLGTPRTRGLLSIEWSPRHDAPPAPRGEERDDDAWSGTLDPGTPTTRPAEPAPRPLAVVTRDEIRIDEPVRFATDSAEVLPDSDGVLGAVVATLAAHPEIRKLRIEGHTDASGDASYNDQLATRRAAAVSAWLVEHGVDASRLESVGHGSRRPVASNDTEEGRAANRRVLFVIVERAP